MPGMPMRNQTGAAGVADWKRPASTLPRRAKNRADTAIYSGSTH
jgi:hypothetical protein